LSRIKRASSRDSAVARMTRSYIVRSGPVARILGS
jgi:hypothetical protein